MTPASTRPSVTACSMSEKTMAVVRVADGNASPSSRLAVVYRPGMAMCSAPDATSSTVIGRFEISSGPQLRPSALPALSSAYRSAHHAYAW